ncbi:hypothetical protein CRN61_02040, partial [Vibrio vulnificus]
SVKFNSCASETGAKLSAKSTRLIALTRQKPHWLVVRDERVKPDFGQAFFMRYYLGRSHTF